MYRSNGEIGLLVAIRIAVHLFIFPETFRSVGYLFCFGILIITRVRLVMTTLIQTSEFDFYFRFYRLCLLIHRLMYVHIQFLVYMSLTVAFWTAVFLFWVSIRLSPKTISTLVYVWHVMLFFGLITAGVVVLTDFCRTMEIAFQTVAIQKLRAKLVFCKEKTKLHRINYYQAKSVYPMRISYGFFGVLGKDFVGEFGRVLTLRCFDVIMLF